eukprot:scaffold72200_cov31-Tisochrysis_lutea.AAC.6
MAIPVAVPGPRVNMACTCKWADPPKPKIKGTRAGKSGSGERRGAKARCQASLVQAVFIGVRARRDTCVCVSED